VQVEAVVWLGIVAEHVAETELPEASVTRTAACLVPEDE